VYHVAADRLKAVPDVFNVDTESSSLRRISRARWSELLIWIASQSPGLTQRTSTPGLRMPCPT
jgi:hypothetical protein